MKHARARDGKTGITRKSSGTKRPVKMSEFKKAERAGRIEEQSPSKAYFEQKRKAKKKAKKAIFLKKAGAIAVICLAIGFVVVLGIGSGMYAAISNEVDDLDFEGMAYNFSSIMYADDKDGNSTEVAFLHDDGNREWVDSDKIPEVAKEAAIAIEDERFLKHNGVDLKRTTGAAFGWVISKITGKSPSYGGSTITQQVMKNITNEKDKTVLRKIKEMMRAVALEKRFTKDEILTTYLNISYFGNQCYGVEAAAKMYFSKKAIDLTLPEAAMIVGITQAPTRFDPFRNPENATNKRNTVLMKMYELEKISKEEYEAAINSPLGVNDSRSALNSSIYSYFVDQVINDVIEDLQEQKGYSQAFASSQVFGGGLKI
ncbi:MAG: penicillin-binding protein, partial [Clostridia bacterium]|nr:penicillin-binding protein [Clostridia bacterium]